jgi:GAF domain-containing protein
MSEPLRPEEALARLEGVMLDAYRAEIGAVIHDPERLKDVYGSALLDAAVRPQLEAICATAAKALGVSMALITLFTADDEIRVAWTGVDFGGVVTHPVGDSFCQHTVGQQRPFLVEDMRRHNLVCSIPGALEAGFIAYLGVPLITKRGNVIGSLCVTQPQPRDWNAGDVQLLVSLAGQVMRLDKSNAPEGV